MKDMNVMGIEIIITDIDHVVETDSIKVSQNVPDIMAIEMVDHIVENSYTPQNQWQRYPDRYKKKRVKQKQL